MQGDTARQTNPPIELQRRFRAPPERVFRAWTQPQALKQWWCPSGWVPAEIEVDLQVGGVYRIGMSRPDTGADVCVCGEFLEVRPPERLVYTWRWEGAFEQAPETLVTVAFVEYPGGTELSLRHENFADFGIRHQHRSGWIAACERMDRILPSPAAVPEIGFAP
jgi:uncharacterized protein YndB with AHSA1/START domain